MSERRISPVDRCPEHVKDAIAHASIRKVVARIIFDIKHKEENEMTYVSDVIKNAIAAGYRAGQVSGMDIVRLYICHACKGRTMMKFYNGTLRFNACKCGYRQKF
jgi:hypothetical protein